MKKELTLPLFLLLLVSIILWASAFVGIRAGLTGYSPGPLALLRYLVASLIMIPLYFSYRCKKTRLCLTDKLIVFVAGVLGFGIYNIALNYGEVAVTSGISSFIISLVPVGTAVLAVIFLKERLNKWGWLGFVISMVGVVVIATSKLQSVQFNTDIFYLLIAAVSMSFYNIMQKPVLKKMHPIEFIALAIWSGTFIMLIFTPTLIREIPRASLYATGAAVYMGIFPGVIAYLAWSIVLKRLPASYAASYMYGLPILATLMGWVLLSEVPLWLSLVGGVIALVGSFVVHWSRGDRLR